MITHKKYIEREEREFSRMIRKAYQLKENSLLIRNTNWINVSRYSSSSFVPTLSLEQATISFINAILIINERTKKYYIPVIPIPLTQNKCFWANKGLVNASAIISSVGVNSTSMFPFDKCSWKK